MVYLAGVDGGATKTHCVISDEQGNILSEGFSGGSNYQVIGEEAAKQALRSALEEALQKTGIAFHDLELTVLGLAGADLEPDFEVLNKICLDLFGHQRFKILNDTWIGMKSAEPEFWGVTANCGTGGSYAGRTKDGREVILRNLSYELGNRGGGLDITVEALHYAFRSEEGTGSKTRLEAEIPPLFGFKNLSEMVKPLIGGKIDHDGIRQLPKLVFKLASEGDTVCQNILTELGQVMGEIAGGIAKRLDLTLIEFPMILMGSVFLDRSCPLLVDEFTTTIHKTAPYAKIKITNQRPVLGALQLALEEYAHQQ
jgi:N-acetylglucosamine kinase-like BadF-type ATPase